MPGPVPLTPDQLAAFQAEVLDMCTRYSLTFAIVFGIVEEPPRPITGWRPMKVEKVTCGPPTPLFTMLNEVFTQTTIQAVKALLVSTPEN